MNGETDDAARDLYLIMYPGGFDERVIKLLEALGVPEGMLHAAMLDDASVHQGE